jgi:hypothetical protein
MNIKIAKPEKLIRNTTIITLFVMVLWGAISVFAEVRPFWVDEWRIIYNLKTKSVVELWGKLAYMQQFPRTYLTIIKVLTQYCDYSYTSLRLSAYIAGIATIISIACLSAAIFGTQNIFRYLMIIMLLSCSTFTQYFVETKQYSMDLLMCTVALWQLIWLLKCSKKQQIMSGKQYILLCASFLVLPFFSYTYIITLLPVYAVLAIDSIVKRKTNKESKAGISNILLQWLPLFICTFSITIFYITDVAQLSTDNDMKHYWGHLMMNNGFSITDFATHIFHLFAQAGSGLLFWSLFGIACSVAFLYSVHKCYQNLRAGIQSIQNSVLMYSVLLILLMIALHLMGKLPLGEPRLNAFAIPAISVMLITMLTDMGKIARYNKATGVIFFILFIGPIGNVYSTIAACFTDSKYAKRMTIYHATQAALKTANENKLPILITPHVAYPYENTVNFPFDNTVPGDWVLLTFPAYKMGKSEQIYAIDDTTNIDNYINQLPNHIKNVMIGDGLNYKIVSSKNKRLN